MDFKSRLIELVKSRPVIWDRNYPAYRSVNKLSEAWDQIGADLGITPNKASQKWSTLRSNYSRYLRNVRSGNPRQSSLAYLMDFLRPHMDIRPQPEEPPNSSCGVDSDSGQDEEIFVQEETKEDELEDEPRCKHLLVDSRNTDAVFLLSLLSEMGRMSPAEKRLFKQKAFELSQELLDGC